jgi:predicted metal-dependent phosphoesterase TrpH
MKQIVLEGHFNATDQAANEFPLLPFEVPPGIARLHVRYQVSHSLGADKVGQQEGNIVDVGLFDPRGSEFLAAKGFRGWSGTKRQAFTVAADQATPGYLPGPIQPGTWHVVLGLYQLAPEGCGYRVVVTLEEERDGAERIRGKAQKAGSRERDNSHGRPGEGGPRWYRGDLHTHTWHSDGSAPLEDLLAAACAQGLDFLAVTEHNTVSHLPLILDQAEAPSQSDTSSLLLIPGLEISTYHGHANVWPVTWPSGGSTSEAFVEFRCWTDAQMTQVRDAMRARGALFSINHPKEGGPPWEFGDTFEPDCLEIWNGPWFVSNYQALAAWDAQLRLGKRITAVGGSDKHQGSFTGELGWYEVGTPCTWVYADALSIPAIVAGLRAGHVFVSEGPAGPRLELTAEGVHESGGRETCATMGDELHLLAGSRLRVHCRVRGGEGDLLRLVCAQETHAVKIDSDDFAYEHTTTLTTDTYWRAEVIEPPEAPLDEEPAALMARALSNPVYAVCET